MEIRAIFTHDATNDAIGYNVALGGQLGAVDEATRLKISQKLKGRVFKPETIKAMSEAASRRKASVATRKKISEAGRNRQPPSEETRQRISTAKKAHWADATYRSNSLESTQSAREQPGFNSRLSEGLRRSWATRKQQSINEQPANATEEEPNEPENKG